VGLHSDNPSKAVDLPTLRTVRPKFALSIEQVTNLLSSLSLLPRTMVGLDILTGLRRGEIFALRWKNIDWQAGNLTVSEAVFDGEFNSPKTEAGNRVVPLSDPALELLTECRVNTRRTEPDDLVFCTRLGKPISPNNIMRRHVFPACDELGLPRATCPAATEVHGFDLLDRFAILLIAYAIFVPVDPSLCEPGRG